MTRLISETEVTSLVSAEDAYQTTHAAHIALSRGLATNVTRVRARMSTMSLHSMSATSTELGRAAAKVYSATRNGTVCSLLLYDAKTGELLAIIEANLLGRLRTSAASSLAAAALLPKQTYRLGIIGSGYQAQGMPEAFSTKASGLSISSVGVFSRDEQNRSAYIEACAKKGLAVVGYSSALELCANSDIVVTATSSTKPVLEFDWIKGIKHISAVGSNALSRQELHPRIVTAAELVVVDTLDAAKAEAGDLLWPIENGKLCWESVRELGNILSGRENISAPSGLSIFSSQGLGVQDLYLASLVYDRACA